MTRVSLSRIVADELATLGCLQPGKRPQGRPKRTEWSDRLPSFGVRHHASGRDTYIVQAMMAGVTRTVAFGAGRFAGVPLRLVARSFAN